MLTNTKQESRREVAERIVSDHARQWVVVAELRLIEAIEAALKDRDERAAKVLETRADELQREWDMLPNAENGFITMTADTPAGYATFWGMNHLRKLTTTIRNEDTNESPQP